METLPGFDLREYGRLLTCLQQVGYALRPVSGMQERIPRRVAFLRHDLDFSLEAALPMAEMEASLGVQSTYYVLLRGPYDARSLSGQDHLRAIRGAGHSLGLHYDLRDCPDQDFEAWLHREVATLADILDEPVVDIALHEPHRELGDPLCSLPGFIHPHDPRWAEGLLYVSDSCRAWRDETLLRCFLPEPPERLLLLTHPALWQDPGIPGGVEYIERILLPEASPASQAYFSEEVPRIWETHPGPQAQDRRVRGVGPEDAVFLWLARAVVEARLAEFQSLFSRFEEVSWDAEQILRDLPGKWTQTLALEREGRIVAFSFNSIREDALYVHAFFVDPEHRGEGLGRRMVVRLGERARDLGLGGLALSVHRDNARARGFYGAHGFASEGLETSDGQQMMRRAGGP